MIEMTKRLFIKSHRGFNLIEAALVLGLVGIIIGSLWVAAAAVTTNFKTSETKKGILTTVKALQDSVRTADAATIGDAWMDSFAINANLVPKNWIQGTVITNPFGGVLEIYFYDIGTEPAYRFDLYLDGLPQAACMALINAISANYRSSDGWITGKYGGLILMQSRNETNPATNVWNSNVFPVTAARSYCPGSRNILYLTFGWTR